MNLVLLETSGNQNYIFATNKLRENMGASQLTYLVGTQYVIEAAHQANGETNGILPQNFAQLKNFLLNEQRGDSIVEIIIATSGKAILLVKSDDKEKSGEKAKEIVGFVTEKTLREAPGLSVYGVVKEFDPNTINLDEAMKNLHEEYEVVRSQLPGPEHRFLRFPFAQSCTTSNFPARYAEHFKPDNKTIFRSVVAQTKRDTSENGRERMQSETGAIVRDAILPKNLEKFEDAFPTTDWLAVIHADGNGLGQIFLNFGDASGCKNWRDYLDKQREFSLALDDCTINAYGKAVSNLHTYMQKEIVQRKAAGEKVSKEDDKIPLLPLVLGGDDLTVICDGRFAVQFAKDFLAEFERQTANNDLIKSIAGKALGVERLSSCAGVAIVKPHFPFHAAYGLAEALLQSAKKVKSRLKHKIEDKEGKDKEVPYPASALDYHILYDTSCVDLERIREHLRVDADEQTHLYARPYLITPKENLEKFKDDTWLKYHHWENLKRRVDAMRKEDRLKPNRHLLPNSMLHDLREGLFMGEKTANSRMKLMQPRYQKEPEKKEAFNALLGMIDLDFNKHSLFWPESIIEDEAEKLLQITGFLDALDIVEFWRD